MRQFSSHIVSLVLGIVVTLFGVTKCQNNQVVVNRDIPIYKTEFKVDTLRIDRYITKWKTVRVPKIVPGDTIYITRLDTVTKKIVKDVAMMPVIKRTYSDTSEYETGLVLRYEAQVTGTLDSMKMGYTDTRPAIIVQKTETKYVQPRGLYIGVESNSNFTNVGPSASLLLNKTQIDASYNLMNKSATTPQSKISLGIKRRIL